MGHLHLFPCPTSTCLDGKQIDCDFSITYYVPYALLKQVKGSPWNF